MAPPPMDEQHGAKEQATRVGHCGCCQGEERITISGKELPGIRVKVAVTEVPKAVGGRLAALVTKQPATIAGLVQENAIRTVSLCLGNGSCCICQLAHAELGVAQVVAPFGGLDRIFPNRHLPVQNHSHVCTVVHQQGQAAARVKGVGGGNCAASGGAMAGIPFPTSINTDNRGAGQNTAVSPFPTTGCSSTTINHSLLTQMAPYT